MARWVLLGICGLFTAFVLLQLWPARRSRRRSGLASVRDARARAASAASPAARALALADAGDAAARARRWTSAAGLFLRALRASPAETGIPARLLEALGRSRPRLVEAILWRRLAALPDDPAHRVATVELASALASLYDRRLRDRPKARVLRRFLSSLERP